METGPAADAAKGPISCESLASRYEALIRLAELIFNRER